MKTLGLLFVIFLLPLSAGKKKETTQVLELPKDPPPAITAETRNLIFQIAPLSNKGLLTQQTKDAIKALLKLNTGSNIVKVRAFVAGNGQHFARRVEHPGSVIPERSYLRSSLEDMKDEILAALADCAADAWESA